VYQTAAGSTQNVWFTQPITGSYDKTSNFVLAENVIALIVWPKISAGDQAANGTTGLTTDYSYDTRKSGTTSNQLPPVVEVTMVTIDEASALHLGNPSTPPNDKVGITHSGTPLFTTATYTAPTQFQTDLNQMETALTASHLNFRVYQTEVAIRGAKWTAK
jgi:uncharacterized protein (TIGR02599 family)